MALTRYQLADKLRTMKQGGSKAPMQNVKLPTNQSSYRTPSMTSTSPGTAEKQQSMGTDPAALARAGGLMGKIGKAWHDSRQIKQGNEVLGGMAEAGGGINTDPLTPPEWDFRANNVLGGLQNANQGAIDKSVLGNGTPVDPNWEGWMNGVAMDAANHQEAMANASNVLGGLSEAGMGTEGAQIAANSEAVLGGLADASQGVSELANASSYTFPGAGAVIGTGLNLAQGNYEQAAAGAGGAAIGALGGPAGAAAGYFLGNLAGRWL